MQWSTTCSTVRVRSVSSASRESFVAAASLRPSVRCCVATAATATTSDLYWPAYRLVVEIDGIHHTWAENVVGDALRQNSLALSGDTVLRLPLLGLRLCPDDFFDQIEAALTAAGWSRDVMRTEQPLARDVRRYAGAARR